MTPDADIWLVACLSVDRESLTKFLHVSKEPPGHETVYHKIRRHLMDVVVAYLVSGILQLEGKVSFG